MITMKLFTKDFRLLKVLSLKLIKMLNIQIEIIDKNLIVISSNLKTYIKEIRDIDFEKKKFNLKKLIIT